MNQTVLYKASRFNDSSKFKGLQNPILISRSHLMSIHEAKLNTEFNGDDTEFTPLHILVCEVG